MISSTDNAAAQVAILSESAPAADLMRHTAETLTQFGVCFREERAIARDLLTELMARLTSAATEIFIVADSTPDIPPMSGRTEDALSDLPLSTLIATQTLKPVLAVPIESPSLPALCALQSTTAPASAVASLAIGKPGAINAALLAIAILANRSPELARKLQTFRAQQTARVLADVLE